MNNAEHEIIRKPEDMDIIINLLNRDTLKNIDTSEIISEGIPSHWHRSIEFSYIRKGEITLFINNRMRKLKAGDFIFVNCSEVHRLISNDPLNTEIVLTIIPYEKLQNFIPDIDSMYFDIYKDEYNPEFYRIFEEFYHCMINPKPYDRLLINSLVFRLLYILVNEYQSQDSHKTSDYVLAHEILSYIEKHYREDMTLKGTAEYFHFSHEYFSRYFKSIFGINFKDYLTRYRLNISLNDVLNTGKHIEAISDEYGFASVKMYIRSFKQYYGITPLRYRSRNRSEE